ncbi:MAG TPA: hypothetical protein VED46_05205 [Alphaproteobacteria bacterium]|nr:hypothetical protein [Alphaproteobacteria bacterium]
MRQLGNVAVDVVEKFRRRLLVERIHRLGVRPTYELIELVPPIFRPEIQQRLEAYGALDRATLSALGADRLNPPPLRLVPSR